MRISDWSSDVCSSDLLAREFLHRWRRLSFRILLIHAVEHRQADRLRVDQFGAVAARIDRIDEPARELDALPALAIAAVEDEDMTRHRITRSEEHTSELQSLMRISYAVFCLKKKTNTSNNSQTQKNI